MLLLVVQVGALLLIAVFAWRLVRSQKALDAREPERWLFRATEELAEGHYSLACESLGFLLARQPDHAKALALRAYARFHRGVEERDDEEGALADAERSIALDGDQVLARLARGEIRRRRGDLSGAIEDADHAVVLAPDEKDGWRGRAEAYLALGDWRRAIEDFTVVLELDREDPYAFTGRARSRLELGELDAAIADASSAIDLTPDVLDAYEVRARALLAKGDRLAARVDFFRAARRPRGVELAFKRLRARAGA